MHAKFGQIVQCKRLIKRILRKLPTNIFLVLSNNMVETCPHYVMSNKGLNQASAILWNASALAMNNISIHLITNTPWTQDLNWTYMRYLEYVQDVSWTSYIRSIYFMCPGGTFNFFVLVFLEHLGYSISHSFNKISGLRFSDGCYLKLRQVHQV